MNYKATLTSQDVKMILAVLDKRYKRLEKKLLSLQVKPPKKRKRSH